MAQTTHLRIGDGNANCGNITGSFNITGTVNKTVYRSDEDAHIMRWLSPLEPNRRHEDVRADRLAGVGDWLLETREFREWRGGDGGADKAVLFCSGNPGVGKTYLSSLVIDSLCDDARKEDIAVVGLYCDFLAQQEQTIINMIGAILKQLLGRVDIPKYLREAFLKGKTELGGRRLLLPNLMGMLRMAIASLPQVFICIDALDEFLPKDLPKLLESLRDIVRESPETRILLTGRPHVAEDIQRYLSNPIVIPISPNTDDIRSYVEKRLGEDADPEAMTDNLRADIIGVILEKLSDIFLLVSLNIDAILGEVTIRQRRKKLEEMTKGDGLSDAYTATLTRLKAQKGNKSALGLRALMWVLYSERRLRARELCDALGVEVGSTDMDVENVPALRTLVASCLGLVTVEASSSTVRLVHYTLQEHLSSNPTLFHSPHSTIAEVCLTYLNFECVRDLSPARYSAPATMPLLEYASYYWAEHIRRGMTENAKALVLRLLDRFDEHISAQLILLRYNGSGPFFPVQGGPIGFTGLHGAAFLGIEGIVATILKMKEWDINATDGSGSTALIWAAARGHEEVVKVLLDREDVNPNKAGANGQTPLSWAAKSGHEGVINTLLKRGDVDPNRADTRYGRTPLLLAAESGHEGVVKILFERRDVNPDQANTSYDRSLLPLAAENGHEGVVKILLKRRDVNPNQVDAECGRTPLAWAARNGYLGVVKILLERGDVNPNQADTYYGRTPLSFAAECGCEVIVKMLLERGDVNPEQVDAEYGRTPLLWAAANGHKDVVKLLLERADVSPDRPDTEYNRTPLSWAAKNGHEGVVMMLLEQVDVNPNRVDTKYAQRLLSWAAENGHEGILKTFLERGDINPDQADTKSFRTPLLRALERGHVGVVEILLARRDVNPNQINTQYGQTPLLWAAEHGHEAVVKVLLERVDVDPNQVDDAFGQTTLSLAADGGHEGVVKMLLERKDVCTATVDLWNQTPLSRALSKGHSRVVKMILERDIVNSDTEDRVSQGSLPAPIGHGSERGRHATQRWRPY